jgi:8-oxo-dGTP pyrophosphatase MutT (NUDIX family)
MTQPSDDVGRWQVLRRETVYTSPWVSLHRDWVRLPDGSIIEGHHVVEYHRPAVGVVATDAAGRVMLVDHDRFISQERSWEIPSGGVEDGEAWEAAARRELLEESGCTGGALVYLGRYRPSIGSTNQLFVLYYAAGVEQTAPITDTNEIIAARWFPVAEVRARIAQDAVPDGLSLTALLLAFHQGYLV